MMSAAIRLAAGKPSNSSNEAEYLVSTTPKIPQTARISSHNAR
jgi:hypothetical protein